MIIQDPDGNDVEVFACLSGGMLDYSVRADDQATFDAVALSVGMLEEVELDDGGTVLRPAKGINISRIGPVTLTPATYDDEGEVVTPAVVDDRYHVDVRLSPAATERGLWKTWAIAWMNNGVADDSPNASEVGQKHSGVTLLDTRTFSSPSHRFL